MANDQKKLTTPHSAQENDAISHSAAASQGAVSFADAAVGDVSVQELADRIADRMSCMAPRGALHDEDENRVSPGLLCTVMLLNTALERVANRFTEQHGLTFPQWMALGCIGYCGEEGIRHSELGQRLLLSKAPITGVVDRLERAGYVRRVPDQNDRRVSRVVITTDGEAAWFRVHDTLHGLAESLCDCLSLGEQEQALRLLTRLLENPELGAL
jgi:MarR family transcriptional regulator, 2-MHQ and catechol-resistance regulon repressor